MEIERINRLLTVVGSKLRGLRGGLSGEHALTQAAESDAAAMAGAVVPTSWKRVSYPTELPLRSFVEDLARRVAFLHLWVQHGPPAIWWLGGLFSPQGFLAAVLQRHARRFRVPVDALVITAQVMPHVSDSALSDGALRMPVEARGGPRDRRGSRTSSQGQSSALGTASVAASHAGPMPRPPGPPR